MRTIQLTDEQIEMILNSLNQSKNLLYSTINSGLLDSQSILSLSSLVDDFSSLYFMINNSDLDV